jgi:hypothetical protein
MLYLGEPASARGNKLKANRLGAWTFMTAGKKKGFGRNPIGKLL